MHLSDNDLKQIDETKLAQLEEKALRFLSARLLADLKESRDRLNQTSVNSSRPPGSDAPWEKAPKNDREGAVQEGEEDEELCKQISPNASEQTEQTEQTEHTEAPPANAGSSNSRGTPPLKKKPGKQKGSAGFGRTQKFKPHQTVIHRPQTCAVCGEWLGELAAQSYTAWDEIDLGEALTGAPGILIYCTRHLLQTVTCHCGHTNRAAPYQAPPDSLWKNVSIGEWRVFGARFAAATIILSLRYRLSRAKIREFWLDFGDIQISTGTIHSLIAEAGRACAPLEEELIKELGAAVLVHADETSWKEAGKLLWLWAFVTTTTALFSVGSRGREILNTIFLASGFTGKLMTDGWSVYRAYADRLRCWAHLIRKAQGLSDSTNAYVSDAGQTMLSVFEKLMCLIYAVREGREGAVVALKTEGAEKVEELRTLCELFRDAEHKKLHEFARELLYDWAIIFRPVQDPFLPLTNNAAEQALRHWVISRQISHGTRTPVGTRVFTVLASVVETCRRRGALPRHFISKVIAAARLNQALPCLPVIG